MKSQQGFATFAGAAWLVAAVLSGGFIAAVESNTKDEATATTQKQEQPSIAVAAAAPSLQETSAIQQSSYVGTSYRDGGHHGDKNSGVKLESIDP